jgi:hypothetical protein
MAAAIAMPHVTWIRVPSPGLLMMANVPFGKASARSRMFPIPMPADTFDTANPTPLSEIRISNVSGDRWNNSTLSSVAPL